MVDGRMKLSRIHAIAGALLALGAAGCPPPPPPVDPLPAVPKPPPEPKCERLDEKCLAKGDTHARIPGVGWVLTPPGGWTYAQESDWTVAEKTGDSQAVLIVATFEPPKEAWQIKKLRLEMLDRFTKRLNITLRNKDVFDVNINKDSVKIGTVELLFWEQDGAKRADRPGGVIVRNGGVLVVAGALDKKEILALGFAPTTDDSGSKAVMDSILTLKKPGTGSTNL